MMITLNEEKVKEIIPAERMQEVMEMIEKSFWDYAHGKIQMPPKEYLYFKEYRGDLRIMPAYSSVLKMAGTKIVTVHPQNPREGLPTVMAVMVLNDARRGIPLALMEAGWLTGMRTGATGGIAVKYLARKDAQTLGMVGAGYQAFFQILAITKVREIRDVFVYDLAEDNVERLAKNIRGMGIEIKKTTLEEAVKKDILVTTTPVRIPVVKNQWILPGTHINAIGADAAGKEELEPQILRRGKVVVDNWEQACHSGEINVPFKKGIISKKDVSAELVEIVAGRKPGRENEKEITIFDSTGLAFHDLYTAHLIYQSLND